MPEGLRTRGEGVRADRARESAWVPCRLSRDDGGCTRLRERMHAHVSCGQKHVWRRPGELRRDVSAAAASQLLCGGVSRYLWSGAGALREGGDCPGEAVRSGMQRRRGSGGMPRWMRDRRGGGNDPVRRHLRHLHRSVPAPDDDHHDLARAALHERRTVRRREWVHGGPLQQRDVRARVRLPRRDWCRELLSRTRRSVRSTVRRGCQRSLWRRVSRVERGLHVERRHVCVYAGHFALRCRCRRRVWRDLSDGRNLRDPSSRRADVPLRLRPRWALWREHLPPPSRVRPGTRLQAEQSRRRRCLRPGDMYPVLCERVRANVGLL